MCECGCSGNGAKFKFPGPRGVVYVLQVYEGCKGCSGPVSVDLHRYRAKMAKEFTEGLPSLEFGGDINTEADWTQASVAVLDLEALRKALSAFALREAKHGVKDEIGADIFAEDAVDECIPIALDAAEKMARVAHE